METSKLDPATCPSLPLDKNWRSVQDLMEEFCVSRATAYRLVRQMPSVGESFSPTSELDRMYSGRAQLDVDNSRL